MTLKVVITKQAKADVQRELAWRREFATEKRVSPALRQALALLRRVPGVGSWPPQRAAGALRRMALLDLECWLSYRVDDVRRELQVLALWPMRWPGEPPV